MPRPKCCRLVARKPGSTYFKPQGVPLRSLEVSILELDEFEALRLADLERLYHEDAAARMGVSRQTFGRIIESARQKVADALMNGKALSIEGGEVQMISARNFSCSDCGHTWSVAFGTGRPQECPGCKSANVHRAAGDRGLGRGRGGGGFGRGQGRRQGRCRVGQQ